MGGEGFELLEAEGVVSLRARRGGVDKPPFQPRELVDFRSISEQTMTNGTAVQRAPTLAANFAAKTVVSVESIAKNAEMLAPQSLREGASMKRVLMEMKQLASGAGGSTCLSCTR